MNVHFESDDETDNQTDCDRCRRDIDLGDDGWIGGMDFAPHVWRGHFEVRICTGCMTTHEALSALDIFEDELKEMGRVEHIDRNPSIVALRCSLAIQPEHQFGHETLVTYLRERGVTL